MLWIRLVAIIVASLFTLLNRFYLYWHTRTIHKALAHTQSGIVTSVAIESSTTTPVLISIMR